MLGTIDIKVRPLKFAYLVDPNSPEQVREAIKLNSTLWGGSYNPIIPLHKRIPTSWNEKPLKSPSAKQVILGYIDSFDPDILVQLGLLHSSCGPFLHSIIRLSTPATRPRQKPTAIAPYEVFSTTPIFSETPK